MDFTYKTPEECGIPSAGIQKFLQALEDAHLSTHNVIIARGNDIVFEKYYPPFHADFLHRQYSDTKSWMSVAVGFAVQDGLVELDAPIGRYFPEESKLAVDPATTTQTVRQMLTMSVPKRQGYWFGARCADRVAYYFSQTKVDTDKGRSFYYDSSGSFILGAMVERVTGMALLDYLRLKLFDKIGISKEIKCLKCPGGHSWGDSALLAKPIDTLRFIRFLLDGGQCDGEQVLNADYLKEATSKQIATQRENEFATFGYGYQIWRTYRNSFYFSGMGGQFAVASPDKDMMLVINSDNQGIGTAGQTIFENYFKLVYDAADDSTEPDVSAHTALLTYADGLKLAAARGEKHTDTADSVNGAVYDFADNALGFKWLSFRFDGHEGRLCYENAQGEKELIFGLCENYFSLFPQEGYAREVGSVRADGNYYRCAASAAWQSETELLLSVQIIDEYFGRLWMRFVFDGDRITLKAHKTAEDFLDEYVGTAEGICRRGRKICI